MKLNQPGMHMTGPESQSVVTDTKEEGSLLASEKSRKGNTCFQLICIGYRSSKMPLLAEYKCRKVLLNHIMALSLLKALFYSTSFQLQSRSDNSLSRGAATILWAQQMREGGGSDLSRCSRVESREGQEPDFPYQAIFLQTIAQNSKAERSAIS